MTSIPICRIIDPKHYAQQERDSAYGTWAISDHGQEATVTYMIRLTEINAREAAYLTRALAGLPEVAL